MLASRRNLLRGAVGILGAAAMPRIAFASEAHRVDISAAQREFLGHEFIGNLQQLLPDIRFVFVDKEMFVPLFEFLSNNANMLQVATATDAEKIVYSKQVRDVLTGITANMPILEEYLNNKISSTEDKFINDTALLIAECTVLHSLANSNTYSQLNGDKADSDISVIIAPVADFEHKDFTMFVAGLRNHVSENICGTARDWARLITLHETGHADYERREAEDFSEISIVCQGDVQSINHERYADRFARRYFAPEQPRNAEAMNNIWMLTRAMCLYNEGLPQNFVNGDTHKLFRHSTALDLVAAREGTAVGVVEHLAANVMAANFIREVGFTLGLGNRTLTMAQRDVDTKDVTERYSDNSGSLDRATFAAIAEGLIQRDAFIDDPLAGAAAGLYVQAVKFLFPSLMEDMPVSYSTVVKGVRDLPESDFLRIRGVLRSATRVSNFCQVSPEREAAFRLVSIIR